MKGPRYIKVRLSKVAKRRDWELRGKKGHVSRARLLFGFVGDLEMYGGLGRVLSRCSISGLYMDK